MAIRYVKQALTAKQVKPKDRMKRAVGALLHPSATRRWMDFVHATPLLAEAALSCPHVLSKIYRPYLSSRLTCRQRVDALVTHYRWVQRLGLDAQVSAALQQNQLLYQGMGRSNTTFEIELSAMHEGHREGELCLRLVYAGECLFVLNFIFIEQAGLLCMQIGRLQGQAGEQGRELVRQATRELHGCRPAGLLVSAARQLARVLGCQTVLMVCNHQRIALNLWRRWKISANYNQTWSELGAVQRPDGWFEIPTLGLQEIDLSSIASKKRSEVKKKITMLDEMYAGLARTLGKTPESAAISPRPLML